MRSIIRKPSIKKTITARTTGKTQRAIKSAVNPLYGKKGMGYIRNPRRAMYNKIYHKASISVQDIAHTQSGKSHDIGSCVTVTNSNIHEITSKHPEIIEKLHKNLIINLICGVLSLIIGSILFLFVPFLFGIIFIGLAIRSFYKSYKFYLAYNDARKTYWNDTSDSFCSKIDQADFSMFKQLPVNSNKSMHQSVPLTFPKYEVHHRVRDKFCDNMNYKLYRCKGTYFQTNRKRTLQVEAFDESEAIEQLKQNGFIEPFEIERIAFPEVTEVQKNALGNIYMLDVCKYDASAILSKRYDNDSTPNPDLLTYAKECRIKFSYYIGKKALYDLIFNTLDLRDKIAFFVFCVYRYTTNDRQGNLNKSPYRDLFYQFSDDNLSNDRFIKSMNKYEGSQLRFFGALTIDRTLIYGGSTKTIAYTLVIDFLKQHFSLSNISNKTIRG